jgi:hypothetical protein
MQRRRGPAAGPELQKGKRCAGQQKELVAAQESSPADSLDPLERLFKEMIGQIPTQSDGIPHIHSMYEKPRPSAPEKPPAAEGEGLTQPLAWYEGRPLAEEQIGQYEDRLLPPQKLEQQVAHYPEMGGFFSYDEGRPRQQGRVHQTEGTARSHEGIVYQTEEVMKSVAHREEPLPVSHK